MRQAVLQGGRTDGILKSRNQTTAGRGSAKGLATSVLESGRESSVPILLRLVVASLTSRFFIPTWASQTWWLRAEEALAGYYQGGTLQAASLKGHPPPPIPTSRELLGIIFLNLGATARQMIRHLGGGRHWGSGSATCKLCGSASLTFLGLSFLHWKVETSFRPYDCLTENICKLDRFFGRAGGSLKGTIHLTAIGPRCWE